VPVPVDPAYLGFRAGSLAARALPGATVPALTRWLGTGAAAAMVPRRLQVERNLRRIYGDDLADLELRRKVAATFDSYARYWIESFRLPGTNAGDLDRGFRVDGMEHIEAARASGRGVIVAMPHLGGWEWGAFWLAEVRDLPVTAVVEPVEPPELAEWFGGLRAQFGMDVVPLGPLAGTACARALKDNRILCLLCDRDIAGGGVPVEFFGEVTTLPAGPATLALRTGAPLLPAAVYFDGRGRYGVIKPPLDVRRTGTLRTDVARVTADIASELETLIRVAPEQWHLMQPNWPSDHEALEGERA